MIAKMNATLKDWYTKTVAYIKDVRRELNFVTWPTRQEIKDSTKIVFVTVIVIAIYIAVLDGVFTNVFKFIFTRF
ncbi:MAG TPA: preprotein translocase subunit SecE [bacterium]|nr:preprotein translocase subunit SecE [bacterium]